jgi:hypothetical protein
MNVLTRWLSKGSRKAFIIDDTENLARGVAFIRNKNISAEGYSDYKTLLYKMNMKKRRSGYKYGLIHENGSKYKPQVIRNFIKKIDPTIQIIIYKNAEDLSIKSEFLALT